MQDTLRPGDVVITRSINSYVGKPKLKDFIVTLKHPKSKVYMSFMFLGFVTDDAPIDAERVRKIIYNLGYEPRPFFHQPNGLVQIEEPSKAENSSRSSSPG